MDKATYEPIAYANIFLFTERDSFVKGTITDEKGVFRIARITPGNYSIKISFIGYNSVILKDKFLNTEKMIMRYRIRGSSRKFKRGGCKKFEASINL